MGSHIGIVAVSPEGAAVFYRHLSRHAGRLLAPHDQPRISVHNEPLAAYIDCIRRDDWHGVGRLLRRSAELLARCGAQFVLSPDNVVQHAVPLAEVGSPIPWLTMTDLVGEAVAADRRKKVGIIGTKLIMSSSTYQTHLGLRGILVEPPSPESVDAIDRIIFGELIFGHARPESRVLFDRVLHYYADAGFDAVILASSEVPLVVSQEASPLPLYDASDVLALAAAKRTQPV